MKEPNDSSENVPDQPDASVEQQKADGLSRVTTEYCGNVRTLGS